MSAARDGGGSLVRAGLARNRLGVASVVFFVVAAAAPLTVVAGAVTTGYSVAGFTGIPVAFMTVAVMLCLFAAGFVAMARRIVNAGAFYTYVAHGLGRPAGVAAAWVALLAYNLMSVGLLGGFGAVAALVLATAVGVQVSWLTCALIGLVLIAVLGVARVELNGKVLAVLLLAEIGVAVLYDAVLFTHPHGGHLDLSPLAPGWLLAPGGIAACVAAVASFVGFESTVVFAEETKDPVRTVPRATYIAIAVTGVLYAASSWALPVATGTAGIHQAATVHGTELMFDLVAPYLGQVMVDVGHLLFLTSLFAGALAFHNIVARYLFALGRERVLPAGLGRAGRSGAPVRGSITQTVTALVVVLAAWWVHADPVVNLLFWLTVAGGFGVAVLMAATSIAVVVFFHHQPPGSENVWRSVIAPSVAAVALLLVVSGSVAQFHILLGVDESSPWRLVFPSLFVLAAVLGLGWAWWLKARRPKAYAAVGLGAHSIQTSPSSPPPSLVELAARSASEPEAGPVRIGGATHFLMEHPAPAQPRLNQPLPLPEKEGRR